MMEINELQFGIIQKIVKYLLDYSRQLLIYMNWSLNVNSQSEYPGKLYLAIEKQIF